MKEDAEIQRKATCQEYGAIWVSAAEGLKVGVARNVRSLLGPVNGLRLNPVGDTTGWYTWAGEGDPDEDPDFFVPLHVEHLAAWRPQILKFLGLPPGWLFLTDHEHEDVWYDPDLLNIVAP